MIKFNYNERRQASVAHYDGVSVEMFDWNDGVAGQAELLERVNQMQNIGETGRGYHEVQFSEELWAEILTIGTIIDD